MRRRKIRQANKVLVSVEPPHCTVTYVACTLNELVTGSSMNADAVPGIVKESP